MKNSKKLIALVLAMVMIFALTASALAATNNEDSTIIVYVTVATSTKTSRNGTRVINSTISGDDPVEFEITSGSTVKDLVDTMSNLGTSFAHDAVWKTVDLVDANGNQTGETAKALVSLSNTATVGNVTTTNVWGGHSQMTDTVTGSSFGTEHTYTYNGQDWMYEVNGNRPTDKYMEQYPLSNNDQVVLLYETSQFSWEYWDILG